MSNIEESLKEAMEKYLSVIDILDKEVRSRELQNEQWFIEWQDKLNEISVR